MLEYNNEATAAHLGGVAGNPFWNINASQFTFVPSFQFPFVQYCDEYRFTATDRNGKEHTFDADKPTASPAPIRGEIPTFFESYNCTHGWHNFRINCQIISAGTLMDFADPAEAEGIE